MIVGSVKTCFFLNFTYKILRKLTCHRTHTFFTFALHMLLLKKKEEKKNTHFIFIVGAFYQLSTISYIF